MIYVYSEQADKLFEQVAAAAFDVLQLQGEAAVELVFLDEEEIRSLNRTTRDIDKATDVLSFPALKKIEPFTKENYPFDMTEDGQVLLGSIVICEAIAEKQATEYGHSLLREKAYLFTHGLLHLLGYDHIEAADEETMTATAEKILKSLDITRGQA